jgi:hypothetical protein
VADGGFHAIARFTESISSERHCPTSAPAWFQFSGALRGGTVVTSDDRIETSRGAAIEWRFRSDHALSAGEVVSVSGAEGPGTRSVRTRSCALDVGLCCQP